MPSLPVSFPLHPFLLQHLLLSTVPCGMGYPFGHLGSAVLAVSSPSFLCLPSLLTGVAAWEAEKSLALSVHSSATTENIGLLSQFSLKKNRRHNFRCNLHTKINLLFIKIFPIRHKVPESLKHLSSNSQYLHVYMSVVIPSSKYT